MSVKLNTIIKLLCRPVVYLYALITKEQRNYQTHNDIKHYQKSDFLFPKAQALKRLVWISEGPCGGNKAHLRGNQAR